ncbi:hypothetical protein ID866_6033 [Astraeus odoratus]|nr:hypothetical protein ID866_6033 [Astraeus odoratus]
MPRREYDNDPFLSYSRSLHDYTLRLWTESRRLAEEKARNNAARTDEALSRRRKELDPSASQSQRSATHN